MNFNFLTKIKRRTKRAKHKKKRNSNKGGHFFSFLTTSRGTGKVKQKIINMTIILGLCGGVLFCIIWLGSGFITFLRSDFRRAYLDDDREVSRWNGESKINILLFGLDRRDGEFAYVDALTVISLEPLDNSIGIFDINVDSAIYIPSAGKNVRLRNLYSWEIIKKERSPVDQVTNGVEELLSIKIHRYIIIDEAGLEKIVDDLDGIYINNGHDLEDKDLKKDGETFHLKEGSYRLSSQDFLSFIKADDDGVENKFIRQINGMEGGIKRITSYMAIIKSPKLIQSVFDSVYTDLSKREFVRIWFELTQLKEVQSSYIRSASLIETKEGDDIVYIPLYERLDEDIQNVFIDKTITKEQARVEVFNSTDIRGLGSFRSRWLQNIGVDVIRVGDVGEVYDKTTVYTKSISEYAYTIDTIKKSFDEEIEIIEGLPGFICTGDVIIILGNNIKDIE
jgi:anionic cell wall polymer biosynthesis LytR-Cps2A-Psr (LCP) family protein